MITTPLQKAIDASWIGRTSPYSIRGGGFQAITHVLENTDHEHGWTSDKVYRTLWQGDLRIEYFADGTIKNVIYGN